MRILSLIHGPGPREAHFYRIVYPKNCYFTIVASALFLGLMVSLLRSGPGFFYILPVLMIAYGCKMLHTAFKPNNWIVAVGPGKLWIKYRSYYHDSLPPEDPQIFELSYDEIASVGILRIEKTRYRGSSKHISDPIFYIVFELSGPIGVSLKNAIYAEREKVKKLSIKNFPVSPRGDNKIVVDINTGDRWKLEKELQQHGVASAPFLVERIYEDRLPEDKHESEEQLIRMIERGEDFGLVHLASKGLNIPRSEAGKYLEELNGRIWGMN